MRKREKVKSLPGECAGETGRQVLIQIVLFSVLSELRMEEFNWIERMHQTRRRDYLILSEAYGLDLLADQTPAQNKDITTWRCKRCGQVMETSYRALAAAGGCNECHVGPYIPPLLDELANVVAQVIGNTEIRYFQSIHGNFVDLSFKYNGQPVAVCYDTPRFHALPEEQQQDEFRSHILAALDWRIIRFRSKGMLPDTHLVRRALDDNEFALVVMTLLDWEGAEWKK